MNRMLVTGGSKGIGAAVARRAASSGWDVCLTYASDAVAADDVGAAVASTGARSIVVRADVSREDDVLAVFGRLDEEWGGLDCLVNNAGVAPGYGPFADLAVADIERTMAVNVIGVLLASREAVRRMDTERGGAGGCIVNIGSKASVLGGAGEWVHYAASKGAVDTMTVGLAREVATKGIRVNCVRPGLVEGGFGPWAPGERVEAMRPLIPVQRPASPDEVAAAVLWLASPEASYVTGALLDVTGGR